MSSEAQKPVELEQPAPYEFKFDIAVAPEFKIELNGKNKIDFYEIEVDDKLIDQQVEMFQSRAGHYDKAETFDPEQRDLLKGDLRELDENGNTLEGGITVEGASLMPQYIKVEDQKKLFDGAKVGDIITFNPTAAYPDNDIEVSSLLKIKKEEVAEHKGNFSYQITEISRFVKAENNAELWKSVYGEDTEIKDEAAFRKAIADGLKEQLKGDSDYKFVQDLRAYCEKKVGDLTFPDALLKRIMLANNQDKGEEFVEKNYEQSVKELTWHLIKEQLAQANDIKVDDNDVRESARQMARAQFAQYGMTNVPEDYLNGYADEMLKKRENIDSFVEAALDRKLAAAIKKVVKLNTKTVTLDEFNKLVSE
jgi:trigger factor